MRFQALCLAVALAGCQAVEPIHTASGQPEMTLQNVDPACVRSALLNKMVDGGFQVRTATDTQIVGGREARGGMARLMLSTQAGGLPEERASILFLPLPGNGLRVVFSAQYVSNAGTGFEKSVPIGASADDQRQMDMVAGSMASRCRKS